MRSLEQIKIRLREFAVERDLDQFHSPKNLAEVEQEIADIQIYLIRLADKLGVDMEKAVNARIKLNEKKYPADKVRGSAVKYNDCDDGC